MKTPIIARLEAIRKRSDLTFEVVAERSNFSTSTLRRWWKGESVPTVEDIEILADAMGGSADEVFSDVGKQEMIATQGIGYQGATTIAAQYEARLQAMEEMYKLLNEHNSQRVDDINDQHEKSIKFLVDTIRNEYEARIADLKEQLASERAVNAIHAEQLHSLAMGILQKER